MNSSQHQSLMPKLIKGVYSLTRIVVWIGYIALVAIILVVSIDICGRFLFNKPLTSSVDIIEVLMMPLGGFAITYAATKRGHIGVDILFNQFSRLAQVVLQFLISLLGFAIWAGLGYGIFVITLRALRSGETTQGILGIPIGPFLSTFTIAIFLCGLTLLIQAFYPKISDEKPEENEGVLRES